MNNLVEKQEPLICEALVREIILAQRWSAVIETWEALLHVRQMAKSMKSEMDILNPGDSCGTTRGRIVGDLT
jgi:hypothetical protein